MIYKRRLSHWLQVIAPLRWGLGLGVRLMTPKHHVGAVGAIFNHVGQVLMVEHVFRLDYTWGLPGGWVNRGENPAYTVQREVKEELNLMVEVRKLLLCEPQGGDKHRSAPHSLGLAYYCRILNDDISLSSIGRAKKAFEILSARWVYPEQIEWTLLPLQHRAIILGKQEFDSEQFAL